MNVVEIFLKDLRFKRLPFYATVAGDYLECYGWKDGDKLKIIELLEDLDAAHNQYAWRAINLTRLYTATVATYQIKIE